MVTWQRPDENILVLKEFPNEFPISTDLSNAISFVTKNKPIGPVRVSSKRPIQGVFKKVMERNPRYLVSPVPSLNKFEWQSKGGGGGGRRSSGSHEAYSDERPWKAINVSKVQQRWRSTLLLCQGSHSHRLVRRQRGAPRHLSWTQRCRLDLRCLQYVFLLMLFVHFF